MGDVSLRCSPRPQYLYATVEGLPRRWRPPSGGVGGGQVVAGALADLVVIASPIVRPCGRSPRALAEHGDVMTSLLDARALFPFRFGTIVNDEELGPWLDTRLPTFRKGLATVRGCVEMAVRLLRLDLERNGSASLGELAERLVERASVPHWRYRPTGNGTSVAASLSFLVPRDDVPVLLARIAPVAARATGVAVVPTGPWPPYSFVPLFNAAGDLEALPAETVLASAG